MGDSTGAGERGEGVASGDGDAVGVALRLRCGVREGSGVHTGLRGVGVTLGGAVGVLVMHGSPGCVSPHIQAPASSTWPNAARMPSVASATPAAKMMPAVTIFMLPSQ